MLESAAKRPQGSHAPRSPHCWSAWRGGILDYRSTHEASQPAGSAYPGRAHDVRFPPHLPLGRGSCESGSRALPPGVSARLATHSATGRFRPDFSRHPVVADGIHLGTSVGPHGAQLARLFRLDWFIRRRDDPSRGSGHGRSLILQLDCAERTELTVLAIVSKIEKFEYAGVAHW